MSCVLSNNQKCPKKPTFFFTSASSPSTAATISPHTASVGETMKSMKPGWYIFWFICCIFCIFLSFHLLASLGGTMTSMQPRWYCVYLLYLLYLFVCLLASVWDTMKSRTRGRYSINPMLHSSLWKLWISTRQKDENYSRKKVNVDSCHVMTLSCTPIKNIFRIPKAYSNINWRRHNINLFCTVYTF